MEVVDKEEVPLHSKNKEQLEEDMKEAKADLHSTEEGINQYMVNNIHSYTEFLQVIINKMGEGTSNLWAQNQHKITLNCEYYGITPPQELMYDIRCLIAMMEADMMARDLV